MDKLLFKRIIIGLLSLCIVSYVIYLFASANFSRAVETEEAVSTTVTDVIYTNSFISRKEAYIKNTQDGVLSYNVSDGDNISVGQNIADIFRNETDAVTRQQIKSINKQITELKNLSDSYYKNSVSLNTANVQIGNNLFSCLSSVNKGDFTSADSYSNSLLYSICERQIITGEAKNFKAKINELRAKKAQLNASFAEKTGSVTSSVAGYFISGTDGYEKSADYDSITELSLKEFNSIKKSKVSKSVIGKVVTDPRWYIACKITADQAVSLAKLENLGMTVYVSMPFVTGEKIPATICSINQTTKNDDGVLILCCDYMSDDISNARKENIEITTFEYSGIKVSKRAIHEDYVTKETEDKDGNVSAEKKKVQGVYVLHGSELIFKEISITYSAKDYVLCDPEPSEEVLFSGKTIKLYDRVVIKGDNLYDGKVIE